jgi:hypothetical protein
LRRVTSLAVTALLALGPQRSPAPPALLSDALRRAPYPSLLDPGKLWGTDDYTEEDIRRFGYWPPWLSTDLDGDGRTDVAAVVTAQSKSGVSYGVLVLHASAPSQPLWIVPLGPHRIYGLASGPGPNAVVPLFCIECDTNAFYRWNGKAYEERLYAFGEAVVIAVYGQETSLGLFQRPYLASPSIFSVEPCLVAQVTQVLIGDDGERWYEVEVQQRGKRTRGYVPGAYVKAELRCIG